MKIFLSVGTQLPFDRLVKVVDEWAKEQDEVKVTAQISDYNYVPKSIKFYKYLDSCFFSEYFYDADIIISHAGMGNIITALDLGKPIFIMPRKFSYGEHRNDHQLSTVEQFKHKNNIYVFDDKSGLEKAIDIFNLDGKRTSVNISSDEIVNFIRREIR